MVSQCDNTLLACHNVTMHLLCCQNCAGAHHLALRRAKCKKLAPYWLLIKRAPREWLIDGRWQQFGLIATCQPPLFGILSPPRIIFDHFKQIELLSFASRPFQLLFNQIQIPCLCYFESGSNKTTWPLTQTYEFCQNYQIYQNQNQTYKW